MDKYKNVTVKGHDYRIGKFDAMSGAYIIPKVTGLLAPVLNSVFGSIDIKLDGNVPKPGELDLKSFDFGALLGPLAKIPEEDFNYLQRKCLALCDVKFKSGYQPVLNDNGSLSLSELEEDAISILALMVHALVHNFSGFFTESPLAGLMSTILPTNSQTS